MPLTFLDIVHLVWKGFRDSEPACVLLCLLIIKDLAHERLSLVILLLSASLLQVNIPLESGMHMLLATTTFLEAFSVHYA